MEFLQYTAGTDDEGRRFDRVIRILLKDVPMSEIFRLMRKGLIRVNSKKEAGNFRIKKGDVIQISQSVSKHDNSSICKNSDTSALCENKRHLSSKRLSTDTPVIENVFKNQHIRVINKPYGMPVHGGGSSCSTSLEQIVKQQFFQEERQESSLSFRPGPLHRLDRNTTGLVVFSQSLEGAKVFSELLQNHQIKKEYITVLCGNLLSEQTWEDFISSDSDSFGEGFHTVKITGNSTSSGAETGKKALTKAIPLSHGFYDDIPITLVLVEIKTGRKHQIRSQCAHHGYPLLGDSAYGGKNPDGINGHFMLHSWRMTFMQNNMLGLPDVLTASIPTNFQFFIKNHLSHGEFSNYNYILV